MILEKQETNGMCIMIVPDYHLEKDSKMYHKGDKGKAGITQWSLWTHSSRQLEFARPVVEEEMAAKRENPGDLQRISLESDQEKNIWDQERRTQKD